MTHRHNNKAIELYRTHRAEKMFDEVHGLLCTELSLSRSRTEPRDHLPRRTINAHVRTLQYVVEDMQDSDRKASYQVKLAEIQREVAKRDTGRAYLTVVN